MQSLRTRACALTAIALGTVALLAAPASADVTPNGKVTIKVHLTMHLQVFQIPEVFSVDGTVTGTVSTKGGLTIPKSGVKIDPVKNITFANGQVTVPKITFTAPADWKGGIDPDSGLVTLTGPMIVTNTVSSPVPASGCPIGPIVFNFSTKQAGGKKYDKKTGKATVFDATYSVPALPSDPPGQVPGCGAVEGVFDNALELPSAPGASTTQLDLTFSPVLTGSGSTTPVTAAATTTTTVPPTTPPTTTAPVAANQLPRTGSSSTPLAITGAVLVAAGAALVGSRRRAVR